MTIISTVFVVDFHHNHSAMVIIRNPCPRPLVVVSSVDPPMCTSTQCLLKYATYYYSSCSPVIRHPGFNSQWLLAFNYFTSYNDTHVTQQTKKKWQQHDFKSVKTRKLSLLHQTMSKFLHGRISNRVFQHPKACM